MWFNFMDHHRHFSFYGYFSESVHKNIVVHRGRTVKRNSSAAPFTGVALTRFYVTS